MDTATRVQKQDEEWERFAKTGCFIALGVLVIAITTLVLLLTGVLGRAARRVGWTRLADSITPVTDADNDPRVMKELLKLRRERGSSAKIEPTNWNLDLSKQLEYLRRCVFVDADDGMTPMPQVLQDGSLGYVGNVGAHTPFDSDACKAACRQQPFVMTASGVADPVAVAGCQRVCREPVPTGTSGVVKTEDLKKPNAVPPPQWSQDYFHCVVDCSRALQDTPALRAQSRGLALTLPSSDKGSFAFCRAACAEGKRPTFKVSSLGRRFEELNKQLATDQMLCQAIKDKRAGGGILCHVPEGGDCSPAMTYSPLERAVRVRALL